MSKKQNTITFVAAAMTSALLAGCAGDSPSDIIPDPSPSSDNTEIKVNADVWQVMEGTRATTFDNQAAIQTERYFTCTAYDEGTTTVNTTSEVNGSVASWNSATSRWEFAEVHKWPTSGALDFFAYMPQQSSLASEASYITGSVVNYSTARAPSFTCALPNDQTGLKEFIWALTPAQSRLTSASGVTMNFIHPFARIRFALSPSSDSDVEVKSVKITGSFYMSGTCTLSYNDATSTSTSAWSSLSDNSSVEIGGEVGVNYLAIPQSVVSHNVVVRAEWKEWSKDVTKDYTVAVSVPQWDPGKSYTYTLTLNPTALKVDVSKYTEQW